jgi:hypothetical protein
LKNVITIISDNFEQQFLPQSNTFSLGFQRAYLEEKAKKNTSKATIHKHTNTHTHKHTLSHPHIHTDTLSTKTQKIMQRVTVKTVDDFCLCTKKKCAKTRLKNKVKFSACFFILLGHVSETFFV